MVSSLLHDPDQRTVGARIARTSSQPPHIDFKKLQLLEPQTYSSSTAYGNSKLANILFATELSERLKGMGVTINSMNPGWIPKTSLGKPGSCAQCLLVCCFHYCCRCCKITRTLEEGTDCIVKLATDPELDDVSGKYYSDCKETTSSVESRDKQVAKKLWDVSLELLGIQEDSPILLPLRWQ